MSKKVFITGGAGFIGSHLADRMAKEGWEIVVYDNLSSGREEFLSTHKGKHYFTFIKGDLLDLPAVEKALKGCDLVFHLAANPDIRYGIKVTDTDLKQNTIVTYNILEAMRRNGVKEICLASTSTIYGEPKVMPTPEDYGPLFPISLYGASKLACEALCTAFAHTFGMKCWLFRFANIVGGRGTHGIIFDFIAKLKADPKELEILGNGKQTKSYLLVDDCVDAMLFAHAKSSETHNVFNLGGEDRIDITSIAKLLIEKMGLKDAKLKFTGGERGWPGDVPQMHLSVKKLAKLGWKCERSSRESVSTAIDRMLKP
ncbi:MAG TPA: NAD-dependent epimerase/dehydratase family protein [Candidatus Omnitrophota bacterium]|nr:NAD-dependent epimerase/dehydratase family protein [Candidatus Omnitrophota bacterium]